MFEDCRLGGFMLYDPDRASISLIGFEAVPIMKSMPPFFGSMVSILPANRVLKLLCLELLI